MPEPLTLGHVGLFLVARPYDPAPGPSTRYGKNMGTDARQQRLRLSFLDAAERILAEADEPLDPEAIVQRAVDRGLIVTKGLTPAQTMKSKLSTDILRRKVNSRFMRSGKNHFALRSWGHVPEFFADRYQKALLDEDIMAFSKDILRKFFPNDGITRLELDTGRELMSHLIPVKRLNAENRYDIIQLVSQFLVLYRRGIATHKRTRRLPEHRLHGVHSLLFGGHLNPNDIAPLFGPFDPDNGPRYIRRELSEEVVIRGDDPSLELVGCIYDPRQPVSRQHLGVLYVVRVTDQSTVEIGERGFLQQLAFETVDEIASHIEDFENWSELVFRCLLQSGNVAI